MACGVAALVLAGVTGGTAAELPGLAVGDKAADLRLQDQAGRWLTFADLREGHTYVALVFHRSADW